MLATVGGIRHWNADNETIHTYVSVYSGSIVYCEPAPGDYCYAAGKWHAGVQLTDPIGNLARQQTSRNADAVNDYKQDGGATEGKADRLDAEGGYLLKR